jgi:16S rRNA G966 N2-methylase RsmD
MNTFPWRKYTTQELDKEYTKLQNKVNEPIKFPIPRSIIGYYCSNVFFQKERLSTRGTSNSKMSALEYWKTPKGKKLIIENSIKNNMDIFRSAVFLAHAPAQFPIVAAGKLYKYFGATNIFDPYAGWGDRCIAAMACNINYTGVDSNPKLKNMYKNMIQSFATKANIQFISGKAEKTNYKKFNFDLIFTSPPFWQDGKMVESYNGSEDDYDSFLEDSLYPIIEEGLKRNVWVCLHLPYQMYQDIKDDFGPASKIININKISNNKIDKIYCW